MLVSTCGGLCFEISTCAKLVHIKEAIFFPPILFGKLSKAATAATMASNASIKKTFNAIAHII